MMLRMCHKFSDLNDGSITGKLAVNLNKLSSFCLFTFQETCALPRIITRVRPRYESAPGMTPVTPCNLKLNAAKNMNEFTFKEETRIVWKVFTLFVYISVVTNQLIRRLKASD